MLSSRNLFRRRRVHHDASKVHPLGAVTEALGVARSSGVGGLSTQQTIPSAVQKAATILSVSEYYCAPFIPFRSLAAYVALTLKFGLAPLPLVVPLRN